MSENKRIKKSVHIDQSLDDEIDARFRRTPAFSFQSVGEDLVKAWYRAGMPFPAADALTFTSSEVQYALDLVRWLRNPDIPEMKPFGDFVLQEFEREKGRK